MTEKDANSYLRIKRSLYSFNQGIVCECCVHRCNLYEIDQYCENKRKKRSLKSVISGVEEKPEEGSKITDKDLEELYEEIDENSSSESTESGPIFTKKVYRELLVLEHNKEDNIKTKQERLSSQDKSGESLKVPPVTSGSLQFKTDNYKTKTDNYKIKAESSHHRHRHGHKLRRR